MKTLFTALILTGILLFANHEPAQAQPGLPSNPDSAPIDGGLGLLAVAGSAYALRRLRSTDSRSVHEEE